MANLRTGSFGKYYGSLMTESEPLSTEEMSVNAKFIYSYLSNNGWSVNSIAALLGNMQAESTINPGRWQSEAINNTSMGYGLVQWTPATKYFEFCSEQNLADPSEMDNNLSRILYELENNIQWIATSNYNMSFKDFSISSLSVDELAKAFLLCYERPADQSESVQDYRAGLAENWYKVITGNEPGKPITKEKKRKGYNFLLFQANRRRKQWIRNL